MSHLVLHVALVAWIIDPILILIGILGSLWWVIHLIFLVHGTIRGLLIQKKSMGTLAGRLVLCFVPVVNLIWAAVLRRQLKEVQEGVI